MKMAVYETAEVYSKLNLHQKKNDKYTERDFLSVLNVFNMKSCPDKLSFSILAYFFIICCK